MNTIFKERFIYSIFQFILNDLLIKKTLSGTLFNFFDDSKIKREDGYIFLNCSINEILLVI